MFQIVPLAASLKGGCRTASGMITSFPSMLLILTHTGPADLLGCR
jgi:hypothetical protein